MGHMAHIARTEVRAQSHHDKPPTLTALGGRLVLASLRGPGGGWYWPRLLGANSACGIEEYTRTIRSTPARGLRKGSYSFFRSHLKGLYGGLHFSLALLLLSA